MNKLYWNKILYPFFLSSLSSCTLAAYSNQELQNEIDFFAQRAIATFKFPKIGLDYEYDSTIIDETLPIEQQQTYGYYFINEVTMKEINVIVSWMKVYWLEYQLSKERNYQNLYADKDVKAFSSGSLISSIEKIYSTMRKAAIKEEEGYGRVNKNGTPAIGDINE